MDVARHDALLVRRGHRQGARLFPLRNHVTAGGNAANCLHVAANGEWIDADCTTAFPYVCQRVVP
ncbi:MAG TPA: hypothetical protein VH062_09585 [Polyangiaceae bacterium]|nr:hypothetical protein [Polyangiaceae bacterium]